MKTLLFALLLTALATISFSQNKLTSKKFETCQFNQNGFTFSIDPRIELWNTMGMLLGYPNINSSEFSYKKEVLQTFSKYNNHKTVQHFFSFVKKGWDLGYPFIFFLHFDKDLNFHTEGFNESNAKMFSDRMGGIDSLVQLAKEIKVFAKEIDFVDFFNSHKDFYTLVLNNMKYNARDFDEKKRIEDFYGEKKQSYNVILNVLEGAGNFGIVVPDKTGENLYAVLASYSIVGDIPGFSVDFQFYNLIYHEFGHSFSNPLAIADSSVINKYANLYEPIKESMAGQAYPNWMTTVYEHLTRASSAMLAELKFGKEIADEKFMKQEIGHKFIYAKRLKEKLDYYEAHRDKYKAYKDFFSELMKAFDGITDEEIAARLKEVNKMREPDVEYIPKSNNAKWDSTMVFIIPTHEKDEDANNAVKTFATDFKSRVNEKIKIITDEEIKNTDLSNCDFIVFGTPEGNSFMKEHIKSLPIIIAPDHVLFKDLMHGKHFQITTSWLSPFNKNRVMMFYTGQQASDIKDYQFSYHKDGVGYWIAQNLVTIAKGDFARFMKIWVAN